MNTVSSLVRTMKTSGLKLPLAAIILAASVVAASAQTGRIMECGARLVSTQPFDGGRLCLFVGDTRDKTKVALRPCTQQTSDPGFLWKIVRRDGGGLHLISATSGEERRMEVADFSKFDGGAVQIWGPNIGEGYRSQTWDFFPAAGGSLIVNVDSGKCLAVPLGRNRLDQEFMIQYSCSRAQNFTWQVEPVLTGADRGCR